MKSEPGMDGLERPQVEVEQTEDGWATLYLPDQDEHYHSTFGAFRESQWIYIERGLEAVDAALPPGEPLHLLEMGFGTGLNAILTLVAAARLRRTVIYTGVEAYPLSAATVDALGYAARLGEAAGAYAVLHRLPWSEGPEEAVPAVSAAPAALSPYFHVRKLRTRLQDIDFSNPALAGTFDLIYYDAFSPRVQPELWTETVAARLYAALKPGGRLVTYCAQGKWKKNLRAAGFTLTMLPGPGGKREITSAEK